MILRQLSAHDVPIADESGRPIEYDIANSIYMVVFDADVSGRPERYEAFRPAFLTGYEVGSRCRVVDAAVDEMIALRIEALGRWLDDLSTAPIGIRTSSMEWRGTLATFVKSHRRQRGRLVMEVAQAGLALDGMADRLRGLVA